MSQSQSEPAGSANKPNGQRPACDRCRGQKLRCTWDAKEPQCQRCQRANAVCTVPLPRPMGRPPRQHLGNTKQSQSQSRSQAQSPNMENPYVWSGYDALATAFSNHEDTAMMMDTSDFTTDPSDMLNW